MKRLFVLMLMAVGLSACELHTGEYINDTERELQLYTLDVFSGYVMMPVMMADMAVDFNAYMALSEEEKAEDYRFYGNIRKAGENTYIIEDGITSCTIETGGKSLMEENAKWVFLSFSSVTKVIGTGDLRCTSTEPVVLESFPAAEEDDADCLFSMMLGDIPVGMELMSVDSVPVWNIGVQGVIDDTDGYVAEYVTGTDGMTFRRRYNERLSEYEYDCSGEFLLSIFRDGEPVDMCKAVFKSGLKGEFLTGN